MFNYAFLKTLDVLYVESDETTNKYFTNILCRQFNNVISVNNKDEALLSFNKNKDEDFDINIIICDIDLSDGCGLDLLEEIRKIDKIMPVILTTQKIEVDGLLKAIDSKATDYLQKPINAKDLVFSVERICQNIYFDKLKVQTQKDLEDIRHVVNEVALVSKTNIDGEITFVNKYFCEITGYDENETIGKSYDIIKDESTNTIVFDTLWKTVKSGKIWDGKLKNIGKNKEEFYLYTTVIPILSKTENKIEEFIWICFLATDDELEQKEFKKKVAKNIHSNRRINSEARNKIDELINKLTTYKNIESSVLIERERSAKFTSQIKFYKTELSEVEEKLKETSDKASTKIKKVLADEKETREKKDKAATSLDILTKDLDIKNKSIKDLTKELDSQIKIIEKLMRSIDSKENEMGMN